MSKEAPVGFSSVRLAFDLDTGATAEQVQALIRLTERYCVIYQTLAQPPELTMTAGLAPGSRGPDNGPPRPPQRGAE